MEYIDKLRHQINNELLNLPDIDKTPLFYEPIDYINKLPGKRLPP